MYLPMVVVVLSLSGVVSQSETTIANAKPPVALLQVNLREGRVLMSTRMPVC